MTPGQNFLLQLQALVLQQHRTKKQSSELEPEVSKKQRAAPATIPPAPPPNQENDECDEESDDEDQHQGSDHNPCHFTSIQTGFWKKTKKKEEKNYKKSVMFEAEKEKSRMILHHPIYLNSEQKEQYQELTMFLA